MFVSPLQTLYSRVPACQVSTYYYVGFAYLMMRRYQDAIRSFTNILLYIQRTNRMMPPGSYQVDLVRYSSYFSLISDFVLPFEKLWLNSQKSLIEPTLFFKHVGHALYSIKCSHFCPWIIYHAQVSEDTRCLLQAAGLLFSNWLAYFICRLLSGLFSDCP